MKYDVASKTILNLGKEAILRKFLDINPSSIQLLEELPEETVSVRRSDFPLHVVQKDGQEIIVLIEIQTVFDHDFVLRLIDYSVRLMLKYHLKLIPLVLLLTPSSIATGFYEDDLLTFRYHIVRFWELQPEDFRDEIMLYPFIPIMNGGEKLLDEAETKIYSDASMSMEIKSDLLTTMAIFAGLKDRDLAAQLIRRRRDIMIQSAAYEILAEEARKEGLREGLREGIKEGKLEGRIEGLHDAISLGLEIKFGTDGLLLYEKMQKIDSIEKLELIKEAIKIADKIEDIEKLL